MDLRGPCPHRLFSQITERKPFFFVILKIWVGWFWIISDIIWCCFLLNLESSLALSTLCVCVCVVCVDIHKYTCMGCIHDKHLYVSVLTAVYAWRPGTVIKYTSSRAFHIHFWDRVSYWIQSTCLHPLSTGITKIPHHTKILHASWAAELGSSCLHSKYLFTELSLQLLTQALDPLVTQLQWELQPSAPCSGLSCCLPKHPEVGSLTGRAAADTQVQVRILSLHIQRSPRMSGDLWANLC